MSARRRSGPRWRSNARSGRLISERKIGCDVVQRIKRGESERKMKRDAENACHPHPLQVEIENDLQETIERGTVAETDEAGALVVALHHLPLALVAVLAPPILVLHHRPHALVDAMTLALLLAQRPLHLDDVRLRLVNVPCRPHPRVVLVIGRLRRGACGQCHHVVGRYHLLLEERKVERGRLQLALV